MTATKKIAVFGTGGNCLDILDTLLDINTPRGERICNCIGSFDEYLKYWT